MPTILPVIRVPAVLRPLRSLPVLDSQDAEPRANDLVIVVCLVVFGLFAWAIVSFPAGMKWERFLHWTGEALLVAGVLLAARGISDVRRQWVPQRLGIAKSIETFGRHAAAVCTERLWGYWNRFIARPLRLSTHKTFKWATDSGTSSAEMGRIRIDARGRVLPPAVTTLERLHALEERLTALESQHDDFRNKYDEDIGRHRAAMDREAAERTEADKRLDERLANAVGGGLRLQTAGVVCLLIGTIFTAIW